MDGWSWLGYKGASRGHTQYGTRWLYRQADKKRTLDQGGHLATAAMPGGVVVW